VKANSPPKQFVFNIFAANKKVSLLRIKVLAFWNKKSDQKSDRYHYGAF